MRPRRVSWVGAGAPGTSKRVWLIPAVGSDSIKLLARLLSAEVRLSMEFRLSSESCVGGLATVGEGSRLMNERGRNRIRLHVLAFFRPVVGEGVNKFQAYY